MSLIFSLVTYHISDLMLAPYNFSPLSSLKGGGIFNNSIEPGISASEEKRQGALKEITSESGQYLVIPSSETYVSEDKLT